jgi:hypothetical protein
MKAALLRPGMTEKPLENDGYGTGCRPRMSGTRETLPSVFSEGLGTATSATSCRTIENTGEPR